MTATAERLARLKNYRTRYEVIARNDNGPPILLGYTSQRSFRGLLERARNFGPQLLELFDVREDSRFERTGATMTLEGRTKLEGHANSEAPRGLWRFSFSGRTQREAITQGEAVYIGDVVTAAKEFADVRATKAQTPDAETWRRLHECEAVLNRAGLLLFATYCED